VAARELEFLTNQPVEGERLSDRLAEAALPPEESLRIALEVGAALQRAHAGGQVHGMVSPAAVLLTPDGARLLGPRDVNPPLAEPYRAPEQVRGSRADWRSDIFSYGSLLYELVSGRRPFPGAGLETDQAIVSQAPMSLQTRGPIHVAMEGVVAGCMEKDPAARRQRIQNAVIELKLAGRPVARSVTPADTPRLVPAPAPPVSSPPRLAMALLAIVAGVSVGATAAMYFLRDHATSQVVLRFRVAPPQPAGYCNTPAISPDGHYLACAAPGADGQSVLWVRAFDETNWNPVGASDGAFAPFWSPDSRSLGFFAKGLLNRVRLGTNGPEGKPAALCETEGSGGGATWNRQGAILFAAGQETGLSQVASTGGTPQPVLKLNPGNKEAALLWPQFLPDGKHFIFFVQTDLPETSGVAVGTINPPSYRFLFPSDSNAVYSAMADGRVSGNGYLLFIQNRNLRGQEFNPVKMETVGQSIALAADVGLVSSLALAPISVSNNGMLAYQKVVDEPTRQLVWMDRSGTPIRAVGDAGRWGPPRISPDGRRAVAAKVGADGHSSDLWLIEENGATSLFLAVPGVSEAMPIWSPDGSRVAYCGNRSGVYDIYSKPLAGNGKEEPMFQSSSAKYPTGWTPDGKYILFGAIGEGARSGVWALPVADRHAVALIRTVHAEGYASVSADGKWLAYRSDEPGANRIYVQPFEPGSPETDRRVEVSGGEGGIPHWGADGAELFYMTDSGHMMAAATHPKNGVFGFDAPKSLFHVRPMPPFLNLYDVSPDGRRFLVNAPLERSTPSANADTGGIMVLTNWTQRIK
jgi:hypothetical protein